MICKIAKIAKQILAFDILAVGLPTKVFLSRFTLWPSADTYLDEISQNLEIAKPRCTQLLRLQYPASSSVVSPLFPPLSFSSCLFIRLSFSVAVSFCPTLLLLIFFVFFLFLSARFRLFRSSSPSSSFLFPVSSLT